MTTTPISRKHLDLEQVRAQLAGRQGQEYWRSLDELAQTEEFEELLHREFPDQASELSDPVSRRHFLKLMGASLAFGGLTSCTIQPTEKIVPYVNAPEYAIPGKPLFYATAVTQNGIATGILVESHLGRPTKIEGNPQHPASLGATDALIQASILDLYDPDRSQVVENAGRLSTWTSFFQSLDQALAAPRGRRGAGLSILTETVVSPTLGHQFKALRTAFPEARWHQYDPAGRDQVRAGSRIAFGEPVNTYYDLSQAQVILSLDADFLYSGPASVRYARQFAQKRRVSDGQRIMNRLYVAESTPTSTGSIADHRLALSPRQVESLALAVAQGLGVGYRGPAGPALPVEMQAWVTAVVRDLERHRGASAIIPGDYQSPAVHALAHAINQALGNVGRTVHHTTPLEVEPVDQLQSLRELVEAIDAGQVEVLLLLGGNPVYDTPADLEFARALQQVGWRAHLSMFEDETSEMCHWHLPQSHFLEAWSDARTYDGTVTIVQPLIEPLYGSRSAHELLSSLLGQTGQPTYDLLREYWQQQNLSRDFDTFWNTSLHDGVLAGSSLPDKTVALRNPLVLPAETGQAATGLEICFRPDPNLWDGRFANNGWLQETSRPITKLTWDNALLLSPATAGRLRLENEQVVELDLQGCSLAVPVWIVPGQAEDTATLHLGYGRTYAGRIGTGTGFNAYLLQSSSSRWHGTDLKLNQTSARYPLACLQDHNSMEGRHLVRTASLAEFLKNPEFAREQGEDPPAGLSLYPEHESTEPHAWGMVIDLSACLGCNACSVACQAENNIPIVGKEQVLNGREMSWIRIDRYYKDDLDDPEIYHQPVPCMHCEKAPCEVVCPVAATVHSAEGLNEMTYNRCVGTRYCANNCPYKVRRFNFLQYTDRADPSLELQRNPDVTVRARGVMEKCTYCVQRISAARIEAKKENRTIRDGELLTACQQVCPTEAIVFGNLKDSSSKVSRLKASPLNYGILTELNTRPRTTYLAHLRNPNPEIVET